ncbi:putative siderophore iron transporter [Xylariales sp. PMI_506]|nr:putative siderophore iron transporter [Xylariales sp. PMI_506]
MALQGVELATIGAGDNAEKNHVHHVENQSDDKSLNTVDLNLAYDLVDVEPEINLRTWIAVAAMLLLNFVQVLALLGPPVVLDNIGKSLSNAPTQTWVPNALSLVQAVLAPVISSASDTFQARKAIMVGTALISFIGSAIAPGSNNIYRLIVAQVLIGFGFASTSLAYSVPSEILPRKWRPMVQAAINIAAALGACSGPLIIGAFTRNNPMNGWRNYYWIQMAFWGATAVGIFVGYRPPKRHTRLDHLPVTEKIIALDLPGVGLFAAGLTLLLVGLNLGGSLFAWTDPRVMSTLIVGIVTLLVFCVYEWKGTSAGMANHDLFRGENKSGRTLAIFLVLIFLEGVMLFAYIIFYPILTTSLFEQDAFLLAVRELPFWGMGGIATAGWGFWSMKAKSIRVPLFTGFLILTAGIAGFATVQPGQSTRACIFSGLTGIGFGAPIILIISGIQLVIVHSLIATATALAITSRAVSASVFTAIYTAAMTTRLNSKIASYVTIAALTAGLPPTSVPAFVQALAESDTSTLALIPGITPSIIASGVAALGQAFADSIRIVWIIAAPFGALACLLCFLIPDLSDAMDYRVEAPVEQLHAKQRH